jgi:carboxymethylenebutenolidase
MQTYELQTADGQLPVHIHRPSGHGPWPAVIVYFDAYGIRPAIQELAARLADNGYVAALPDLYYRTGPYGPLDPAVMRANPAMRDEHRDTRQKAATTKGVMADTAAVLDLLESLPEVQPGPVGATGYCMGGRLALTAAGNFPDRIAVAASYHGGGLASDKADSPHLLAPKTKAKVYVAGASEDPNFPDDMKDRLDAAFRDAGLDYKIETYPAKHGWVMRDNPVHDPAETEHHWRTLVPLLDGVLKA